MDLEQKLKELPEKPGVYIMYDRHGTIIYIGKAKILRNRVRQYFSNSPKADKVAAMVSHVADFEYIIAKSELDALALEANLIKKHKPHYNILLKDDKAKPYIRIDTKALYPQVEITRRIKADGAKYFGPYFGVAINEMAEIIRGAYHIRNCSYKKFPKGHRECLNYHMGLCSAPCTQKISPELYRRQIDKVIAFLSGKDEHIDEILKARMEEAAENERFEEAITYRNRLQMLEKMKQRIITTLPKTSNIDIFAYAYNASHSVISALIVRAGKMSGAENYPMIDASLSVEDMFSSFLVQYYDGTRNPPDEIVLPVALLDEEELKNYIYSKHSKRVCFTAPKKGIRKQLLDTAQVNAEEYLSRSVDKQKIHNDMTIGAIEELYTKLGLRKPPYVMECYDISNISGTDKVASMVVFKNGEPDKSSYRRFRIDSFEGADDFRSMHEVIERRLEKILQNDQKFGVTPDLMIIDGGKGQLSSAHEAMKSKGLDIELISLAKREEEVFLVGQSEPIVLPKHSWGLKLLQRIRDEAHRFAITYHRGLRQKRYLSELTKIKGIGENKARLIWEKYPSINSIKSASVEELSNIKGLTKTDAQNIAKYFALWDKEVNQDM